LLGTTVLQSHTVMTLVVLLEGGLPPSTTPPPRHSSRPLLMLASSTDGEGCVATKSLLLGKDDVDDRVLQAICDGSFLVQ
jgi:hypothetical protein